MGSLVPIGAAALGLQLLAVVQIEVGLLEAIKRAGVILSVVLAARLFGERSAWGRLPDGLGGCGRFPVEPGALGSALSVGLLPEQLMPSRPDENRLTAQVNRRDVAAHGWSSAFEHSPT